MIPSIAVPLELRRGIDRKIISCVVSSRPTEIYKAPPSLFPESLASCQRYQPTITFTCPNTGMLCPPEAGICTRCQLLKCSAIQHGLLKKEPHLCTLSPPESSREPFLSFFYLFIFFFFWIHDYETGNLIPWVRNISSAVITRAIPQQHAETACQQRAWR